MIAWLSGTIGGFSPASLFAFGEVGAWYDPSDLTTLFQDTAGLTPVTTPGQTVALMLDKSRVPAPEARRNLLTFTEQFENAAWFKVAATITANTTDTTDPFGGNAADRLNETATTAQHYVDVGSAVTVTNGATYTRSVYLKLRGRQWIALAVFDTTDRRAWFDIQNGVVGTVGAGLTASISDAGNGWWRCTVTRTVAASSVFIATLTSLADNGATSFAGDTARGFYIYGAQLERSSTVTAYQAIGASLPTAWLGTHATQATAASRPTYGIVPATGRRNFILHSNTFSNAAWEKLNTTLTANAATDPVGGNNAWRFQTSGAGNIRQFTSELLYSTGVRQSIYVRSNTGSSQTFALKQFWNNPISLTATTAWQRFDVVSSENFSAGGVFIEGTNLDLLIFGAQLETATTPSAYQQTTTRWDVTEAGVPSLSYLGFDGVDDGMLTSAINFSATNKVAVFAGLRKLSDVARGTVTELTASVAANNGGFHLTAPNAASATFAFESKGTALTDAVATSIAAPATRVLTGAADIGADSNILRVNGVQADSDTGDQGTGNYANAILYIGRRGGATLPLNGNIYGLIVRGAATTDAAITSTETWLNQRTGAY